MTTLEETGWAFFPGNDLVLSKRCVGVNGGYHQSDRNQKASFGH